MKKIYPVLLALMMIVALQKVNAQTNLPLNLQEITGDIEVCRGETTTYSIDPVAGAQYSWNACGHFITPTSNPNAVQITWGAPGSCMVSVTVYQYQPNETHTYSLAVNIHPLPDPVIMSASYPGCPPARKDSLTSNGEGSVYCEKVCEYAEISYSTPLNPGSTYLWVAEGGMVNNNNSNTVTVAWGPAGPGLLTVTETNAWGCTGSANLCVIILDNPIAQFTYPENVCLNELAAFVSQSTGAVSYIWDFGDGVTVTTTEESVTHTYDPGGTYTVTLIVISECFCKDTITHEITVDAYPAPPISCPSTVCAGATVTYSTMEGYGCIFEWFAEGGQIQGPSNLSEVTVLWGPGQMGRIGLLVTGCTGFCSDTAWVSIPIIPTMATISGPEKVCAGSCEVYTLPHFSGAIYNWSLNSSSCGTIPDNSCHCETIKVCWDPFVVGCVDTLIVEFRDTTLGCNGTARLPIHVLPTLRVFGPSKGCSNGMTHFMASNQTYCNWSISPQGPALSASPAQFLNVNWNGLTGMFFITAYPDDPDAVCNDSASFVINVLAPPAEPVITGENLVCPHSATQYSATASGSIHWTITGGTPASAVGNCVTVIWGGTPPFSVQAYAMMQDWPYCSSPASTLSIGTIPAPSAPIINGPAGICANSTTNYSTPTVYPAGATYEWTINPSNAGAILSGQNTNAIAVEWGNNAGLVTLKLKVSICDLFAINVLQISLGGIPVPVIAQNHPLCPGGSAVLSASGGNFIGYQWSGPAGFAPTTDPTATITLSGLYRLTVTDASGCSDSTVFNVHAAGGPTASISSPDRLIYCPGETIDVDLYALGNPDYTYSWSTNATTPDITVNQAGSYSVTVTDINQCWDQETITVLVLPDCPPPPVCIPDPGSSVNFTQSHLSCNEISFTNTSVNAGNFYWDFGDNASSTLDNPTHTYSHAGYYLVQLCGQVPNASGTGFCTMCNMAPVEIPAVAKFISTTGCFGEPVSFTDQSVFLPGYQIASWLWDFGDGASSALQNPDHIFTLPGTYNVTLTLTVLSTTTGFTCNTSAQATVAYPQPPTAAFTTPDDNCINSAVFFQDNSTPNLSHWNWDFGDNGTSLNQNPSHSYPDAGSKPVTLIIKDTYGCPGTVTQGVYINEPVIDEGITAFPDDTVCSGTPVLLVAPFCSTCNYLWGNGSANDSITVTVSGRYTVTVTDANGCDFITYLDIIVYQSPYAEITGSTHNICIQGEVTLSVPCSGSWSYEWISNDPNFTGPSDACQLTANHTHPGHFYYQVIITDNQTGCSSITAPFFLNANPPPALAVITASGPNPACEGETITLEATHADPTVTLQWSNGDTNSTIQVTESGFFYVVATDTNGCTSAATYNVTINRMPDLCDFYVGCIDTCLLPDSGWVIHGPAGGASYSWLLDGYPVIPPVNTQDYTVFVSGNYSVVVTNLAGCIDTTGILELNLTECPCSAMLVVDSVYCKDITGTYIVEYHIINNSEYSFNEISLFVEHPPQSMATVINLPAHGNSGPMNTGIPNLLPGDSLCLYLLFVAYDAQGGMMVCTSYSDTVCVTLPVCDTCGALVASFTYTNTGLQFDFTSTSTIPGWLTGGCQWDFGDPASGNNNLSWQDDPSHVFTQPGDYLVCLLYTAFFGDPVVTDTCYARDCQLIHIDSVPNPCDSLDAQYTFTHFGLSFTFTNASTYPGLTVTDWLWTFDDPGSGNHNTSHLENPYHAFTQPGDYLVCLVVTAVTSNGYLCHDTICYELYIPPCEGVDGSYTYTGSGLNFNFTGIYTIPSWLWGGCTWDFGDPASGINNWSSQNSPTHTFSQPGDYLVCFVVAAFNGYPVVTDTCYDSICQWIHVSSPCENLQANFTYTASGLDWSFTNTTTYPGLTITEWQWNFDDWGSGSNTSSLANPLHTFTAQGNHVVCLVVTAVTSNGYLCHDTACYEIWVDPNPCHGLIAGFTSAISGLSVHFSSTSLYPGLFSPGYVWNFGDPVSGNNNHSSGNNPTHVFSHPGNYTVCLLVLATTSNGDPCSGNICHVVHVGAGSGLCDSLVADFTYGISDLKANFTNTTANPGFPVINWQWNFGDPGSGSDTSSLENPAHSYTQPGLYNVCLTVTASSDSGDYCIATICYGVKVGPYPYLCDSLIAGFTNTAAGLDAAFTNTTANPGFPVIQWLWNFGDPGSANNTSTQENPAHTFTQAGSYLVCLYVTALTSTGDTCPAAICHVVQVGPGPDPCDSLNAGFTYTASGLDAAFTNTTTYPGMIIDDWLWNFGDPGSVNNASYLENPAHTFTQAGSYNVCLYVLAYTAAGDTCYDTVCYMVQVGSVPGPCDSLNAGFTYGASGMNASFMNTTTYPGMIITGWHWNFDDPGSGSNNTSSLENPSHAYSQPGFYNVCLTVTAYTEAGDSCFATICHVVQVGAVPSPCDSLIAGFTNTAAGLDAAFTNTTANPGFPVIQWQWNFGDQGSANNTSTQENPAHTYSQPGFYNVCLTVTAYTEAWDSCFATICHVVHVGSVPSLCDSLVAGFTYGASGLDVAFMNTSTNQGFLIINWQWNFGDPGSGSNNTSSLENPAHTYTQPGIYDVCLTVTAYTDAGDSCFATICHVVQVGAVPSPCDSLTAGFTYSASGLNVNFTNTAINPGLTVAGWYWTFGDPGSGSNNTSSLQYPSHAYTQPGFYNVCLTVTAYTDAGDSCFATICQVVQVGAVPDPCDGLNAAFDVSSSGWDYSFADLSTAPGGLNIIGWSWIFGDPSSGIDNTSGLQNPVHTYTTAGTYWVYLLITAITQDGNTCTDSAWQFVDVLTPPGNIFGGVYYDKSVSTPLSNVVVSLMSGQDLYSSAVTDASGQYTFTGVVPGNYQVLCSTQAPWGGGNAADGLLILKYTVGMTTLDGVRLTAADLDASGYVNAVDALFVLKRYVGMINAFNAGDWAFETPAIVVAPNSNQLLDIRSVCYGDVNASYVPAGLKDGPGLSLQKDGMQLIDIHKVIEVPVKITGGAEIAAVSLALQFPEKDFTINKVRVAYDNQNLVYHAVNGELRIAWNTLAPRWVSQDETLLWITIHLNNPLTFDPRQILFSLQPESSIADFDGEMIPGKTLSIPALTDGKYGFILDQNKPNPFTGITQINYYLPEEGDVKLELFDLRGQSLRIIKEGNYPAGTHSADLSGHGLEAGVYYYRMTYISKEQKYIQTRRLVISR